MSKRQPDYDHINIVEAPPARIPVKAEDYDAATPKNQYRCGIARAVQRIIPDAVNVRVNKETISWREDETFFSYPTPEVAIEAIIKPLDTGVGELKPITLRLTGGYARPVKHKEKDELRKMRQQHRAQPNRGRHLRTAYERFTEDA